ncbi:hypothetical protein FP828_01380 [bacterium]|nr:hypothetical protein [bacterium]
MKVLEYWLTADFLMGFALLFYSGTAVFAETAATVAQNDPSGKNASALVVIGGAPITHQELYSELYRLYGDQVLSQMMEERLIKTEAEQRKISAKDSEIDKAEDAIKKQLGADENFTKFLANRKLSRDELREKTKVSLLGEKMIVEDKKIEIDSQKIKDFFEVNKEKLGTAEQIKIRHILVGDKKEADDLVIALKAGADFAKLCELKSLDEATKNSAGDLGFFSRGMLSSGIEDIAFGLKEGEISAPVKVNAGWHILQLEKRVPQKSAKLDSKLKKQLEDALRQSEVQKEYPGWIKSLSDKWVQKQ